MHITIALAALQHPQLLFVPPLLQRPSSACMRFTGHAVLSCVNACHDQSNICAKLLLEGFVIAARGVCLKFAPHWGWKSSLQRNYLIEVICRACREVLDSIALRASVELLPHRD